ncbi:MAG: hypothetical protein PHH37_11895 [Paludibacter sp.]|nr:hypothetical protein [Paludibacter sp.]
MKKYFITVIIIFGIGNLYSQTVKYSTSWFGPNANPVPEFSDATIPQKTNIDLTADYYQGFGQYGNGDKTINGYFKIELPLLPERVSLKVWTTIFEHYNVTQELGDYRGMGNLQGKSNGDFYVQTRISVLKERESWPAIILNSTLKTASGTDFADRRYFDTPGYYFDVEFGKSLFLKSKLITEIRAVADLGFLCWETTGSRQDDAPMYGVKLIAGNEKWKFENTFSGYWGWMHTYPPYGSDYGDAPMVYTSKFIIPTYYMNYFVQYQYGIKDFPYQQFRFGISFPVEKLTPKYR